MVTEANLKSLPHSIRYNFFMNLILTGSRFIYPLIVFPYVARVLNAEGIGKVSFAQSVVSYFYMFAALGIPSYGIRACARVRENKADLSKVAQELFIISSVTMLLSYICYFSMLYGISGFRTDLPIMLICSLNIFFQTVGMQWFFQGIEEYQYITFRTVIVKGLSVVFIILMVRNQNDALWYAAGSVLAEGGSALCNLFHLHQIIKLKPFMNYKLKKHIRPIMVFFASSIAITVYSSLDSVMLGIFSTNRELGFYTAGLKISRFLAYITTALGSVTFPRISNYLKRGMEQEANILVSKSMHFSFVTMIPLVTFMFTFSKSVILIYAGNGFEPAGTILKLTAIILLFSALSNTLTNQVLLPRNKEKYVTVSVCLGAVIDLLLNIILIPSYGAIGAASSTVITEMVVAGLELIFSRKYLRIIFSHINFGKTIVSLIIMVVISSIFDKLWINSSIQMLGLTFILCCSVYCIVQVIMKDSFMFEVLALLKKRLK